MISVPSFRTTKKFVLLDLETLECYEYQIDCSALTDYQKAIDPNFKVQSGGDGDVKMAKDVYPSGNVLEFS